MKKCNHSTSDFTNETRNQTQWELNQGIHPITPKTKVNKVSIACMLNQGWNKAQNSAPSQSTGDVAWSRAGACMSKSGKAFLRLSLLVLSAQWEAGARCILMPLAATRDAELDYFLFWAVTEWMLWSTYLTVWFISCFTDEKSLEKWLRFYMKQRNCFAFAWKRNEHGFLCMVNYLCWSVCYGCVWSGPSGPEGEYLILHCVVLHYKIRHAFWHIFPSCISKISKLTLISPFCPHFVRWHGHV